MVDADDHAVLVELFVRKSSSVLKEDNDDRTDESFKDSVEVQIIVTHHSDRIGPEA